MEVKPITDVNYVTEKLSVEWLFIKNLTQQIVKVKQRVEEYEIKK